MPKPEQRVNNKKARKQGAAKQQVQIQGVSEQIIRQDLGIQALSTLLFADDINTVVRDVGWRNGNCSHLR